MRGENLNLLKKQSENTNWEDCIKRLSSGDTTAFKSLYDSFHHDLFRFSIQLVKSRSLAQDIVQEVYIKIWERRQSLDNQKSIKAYLFTICRNLCIDMLEKASKDEPLQQEILDEYEITQIEDAFPQELEQLATDAINALPPQRRLVFEKAKLENMSYEQIAQSLNISKGTVSDHLVKAMRAIKAYLQLHKK